MNETSHTPPPVPGEQLAATLVPTAAPDLPTQVLGTGPTRVEADSCGHHLRAHEARLREISARRSRASGAVHHCGAFALATAK